MNQSNCVCTFEAPEETVVSFAHPLILVGLSTLILLVLLVVSSKKTFLRCLKLSKVNPQVFRRDSALIGIIQQDMIHQMHSLVLLPLLLNNGKTSAIMPKESTVKFISKSGEHRESNLIIHNEQELDTNDDEEDEDNGEVVKDLYGQQATTKLERINRKRQKKKRQKPIPIPPPIIKLATAEGAKSGLELMLPGLGSHEYHLAQNP
ncbi:uncharacterized protein LOC131884065 [Tigriopus californicus]|uniref:uncharacterized protein LOC131884065 n=1 Tax=Tigriopus californicus TaxID=6832 RepID=UPI0027D9FFC8|nr:uncharacterized protein LOC131884065 [Tigriopus californicus]